MTHSHPLYTPQQVEFYSMLEQTVSLTPSAPPYPPPYDLCRYSSPHTLDPDLLMTLFAWRDSQMNTCLHVAGLFNNVEMMRAMLHQSDLLNVNGESALAYTIKYSTQTNFAKGVLLLASQSPLTDSKGNRLFEYKLQFYNQVRVRAMEEIKNMWQRRV